MVDHFPWPSLAFQFLLIIAEWCVFADQPLTLTVIIPWLDCDGWRDDPRLNTLQVVRGWVMWSAPIIKVIIVPRRVMASHYGLSYYGHPDSRVTPHVWKPISMRINSLELELDFIKSNIFLGILIGEFSYFHRDSFHQWAGRGSLGNTGFPGSEDPIIWVVTGGLWPCWSLLHLTNYFKSEEGRKLFRLLHGNIGTREHYWEQWIWQCRSGESVNGNDAPQHKVKFWRAGNMIFPSHSATLEICTNWDRGVERPEAPWTTVNIIK